MKKKFNETMVIDNGKLVYAIQLKDKGNSDRSFIKIRDGKIYFSDSWFTTTEFDFNNETHRIAKEIFVNQLQTDIKTRVMELKQLEEVFKDLNLSECFANIIPDSAKILTEVKKDMLVALDSKVISIEEKMEKDVKKISKKIEKEMKETNENLEQRMETVVEETVKPIARKKKKRVEE